MPPKLIVEAHMVSDASGRFARDDDELTSDEVIAAFRSGRITAEGHVENLLGRAEQLRSLNAFITVNADGALAAARALDAARARGDELPPLAGLVIAVKDNINMHGLATTAGTPALRNARPSTTAPSLRKLLDAGAIVLGKTNMHELAFGITSTNLSPVGPVGNPYDPMRIP